MQQAYFSESNKYGGWTLIGYTAPQTTSTAGVTTNFTYTEQSSKAGTWNAASNVKLNDCSKGSKWTVVSLMAAGSQSADVNHTADVSDDTNCGGLTPSFESLSVKTK